MAIIPISQEAGYVLNFTTVRQNRMKLVIAHVGLVKMIGNNGAFPSGPSTTILRRVPLFDK